MSYVDSMGEKRMKVKYPLYMFSYCIISYALLVAEERIVLNNLWFFVLNTLGITATHMLLVRWKWKGLERKVHPALAASLLIGGPLLTSWLNIEAGVSWEAGGMRIIWTALAGFLILLLLILNPLKVKKDPLLDEALRREITRSDWERKY